MVATCMENFLLDPLRQGTSCWRSPRDSWAFPDRCIHPGNGGRRGACHAPRRLTGPFVMANRAHGMRPYTGSSAPCVYLKGNLPDTILERTRHQVAAGEQCIED